MWGTIIAAAWSAAAKLYSNYKSSQAAQSALKKQEQGTAEKRKMLTDWYNRDYNEDATQRADAQRMLTLVSEQLKNRNKAAQGRAAVMGATEEGVAAEKERNNKAYADIVSNIAATNEARKDKLKENYQKGMLGLKDEDIAREVTAENNRATNIANAGATAASVLSSAGAGIDKAFEKGGVSFDTGGDDKSSNNTASADGSTTDENGNKYETNKYKKQTI